MACFFPAYLHSGVKFVLPALTATILSAMSMQAGAVTPFESNADPYIRPAIQGQFVPYQQAVPVIGTAGRRLTPRTASPAMWQIKANGATVTLVGSVHTLPGQNIWTFSRIPTVASAADELVFEAPVNDALISALTKARDTQGVLPDGESLYAALSDEDRAAYVATLKTLKWSASSVDNRRPWLVAMLLDMATTNAAALTQPGPDMLLMAQAKKSGKPVRYLETVEQQMALLVPKDPVQEKQLLAVRLKNFAASKAYQNALVNAWASGDVAEMDALIRKDMAQYPALRAAYLTDRNKNWANQIVAMLAEKKNVLVVVGVGHLVGEDSIPALLRADGYSVDGP